MIGTLHGGDCHPGDVRHRTAPTTVDHTGGTMLGIVEDDGDAVGGRYTDTDTWDIRHQGIDTLQHLTAHVRRQSEEGTSNLGDARRMYLMGHDQAVIFDSQ